MRRGRREVSHAAGPADDLAFIVGVYGESFLRRMARDYPLDAAMLDRARFMAAEINLWWALTGLRSNDPAWFFVHFDGARDALPIGVHVLDYAL